MSSPKKIGRWNRFEIAFAKGNWPRTSLSQTERSQNLDKTQGLRKMEKDASATSPEEGEFETRKGPFSEFAPSQKKTLERLASANLTEEARRREANLAKKRAYLALKSEKTEKSTPLKGRSPFRKPRPRTFRSSEPPRRFDKRSRDEEKEG